MTLSKKIARKAIVVRGLVQGVGFRPFIHRLAHELKLSGFARNDQSGVHIEIEGSPEKLAIFLRRLKVNPPLLASIESVEVTDIQSQHSEEPFFIAHSLSDGKTLLVIPRDSALCSNCLAELFDKNDRRFLYPFINCTDCGPRYTIIASLPYDRPFTTMRIFDMCPECRAEYDDIKSRRHHAQPNACPICGPQLTLLDNKGNLIAEKTEAIIKAKVSLKKGGIVALKSLGGFQLACDALNESVVRELRKRKRRPTKPFAIMTPNISAAKKFIILDASAENILASPAAPILLCPAHPDSTLAPSVSAGVTDVGVMIPYTPLHYLIFFQDDGKTPDFQALVMTSGNLTEEVIAIDNCEALKRLADIADLFLVHDRPILSRCDDSVAQFHPPLGRSLPIRIGRGYAPLRIRLSNKKPPVLALGAGLKNTVCVTRDDEAFISQHIGDLDEAQNADFLTEVISHLLNLLRVAPTAIACDIHPDFFSTRYAENYGLKEVVTIQHHFAHTLSVIGEFNHSSPLISIVLDGTGLGDDDCIWGGELLVASLEGYERFAHLSYLPLIGGDRAIKKPWRIAGGYLMNLGMQSEAEKLWKNKYLEEFEILIQMLASSVNSPLTSSAGRLFDAVSALLGVADEATYEAEAAMRLEALASKSPRTTASYPVRISKGARCYEIRLQQLFEEIVGELEKGVNREEIAFKFHNFVVEAFIEVAKRARDEKGINDVALSGGAFANRLLVAGFSERLGALGFNLLIPKALPMNDAGVSFGQAVFAREVAAGTIVVNGGIK
ncbi:MAG: carbamoyltransferase HypF [Myxococcota bacterium]